MLASLVGQAGSLPLSLPASQVWMALSSMVAGAVSVRATTGVAMPGPTPYSPTAVAQYLEVPTFWSKSVSAETYIM